MSWRPQPLTQNPNSHKAQQGGDVEGLHRHCKKLAVTLTTSRCSRISHQLRRRSTASSPPPPPLTTTTVPTSKLEQRPSVLCQPWSVHPSGEHCLWPPLATRGAGGGRCTHNSMVNKGQREIYLDIYFLFSKLYKP